MYMAERMPKRHTTAGIHQHPREPRDTEVGRVEMKDIKPLAVDRWFASLPFAPKTKSHIKGVMRQVFEYAMLCELFEAQRNPMDFVRVERGTMRRDTSRVCSRRKSSPGCCSSFPSVIHRNMVIVAVCLGLRRSELMGLKWSDFDWINGTVLVQRGVVANRTDAVKTKYSKKQLPLDPALIAMLQDWRQMSEFKATTIGCGLAVGCRRDAVLPKRDPVQLHSPGGQAGRLGRQHRLAHVPAHVSGVARPNQGTHDGAEGSHASRQHLDHHERLRWRDAGADARGQQCSRPNGDPVMDGRWTVTAV